MNSLWLKLGGFRKVSAFVVGLLWLSISGLCLANVLIPEHISFMSQYFDNSVPALLIFAGFGITRGAIGFFTPELYNRIFRDGVLTAKFSSLNAFRFRTVFLISALAAWTILFFTTDFSVPTWLILWFLGSLSLYGAPIERDPEETKRFRERMRRENDWDTNPATGLPMYGIGIDSGGHAYGRR